jgi:spermidine synthase
MTRNTSVLARLLLLAALFAAAALARGQAYETILYEKPSAYSTIVVSEDRDGLRILRFEKGGARQSVVKLGDPDYLALNYTPVAFLGLALVEDPRRLMVVGLGGGTMPMFLRNRYPNAAIDAVDIDPDVVHVAREYFGFREDPQMRAHVADGREFVEQTKQPYDAIFLDAFGSRNVPRHLTTVEFLRGVRRALSPGGVVVGNIWSRDLNPLYDAMVRTYQEVFDDLYIIDVAGTGNRILLALPKKRSLRREDLVELARNVTRERNFPFDLADLGEHRFLHAARRNTNVRVLRDADLPPRAQPQREDRPGERR